MRNYRWLKKILRMNHLNSLKLKMRKINNDTLIATPILAIANIKTEQLILTKLLAQKNTNRLQA